MKIAVIGSRTFQDYKLLCQKLDEIISQSNGPTAQSIGAVSLLSGGAPGADSLAYQYAKERGIPIQIFMADWDDITHPEARVRVNKWGKRYDANAGFRRNTLIIENADLVVAFHNGSPGTADSLKKAYAMGKNVLEVRFQ